MAQHDTHRLEVDASIEPARRRGVTTQVYPAGKAERTGVADDQFVEQPSVEGPVVESTEERPARLGGVSREVVRDGSVSPLRDGDESLVAELAVANEDERGGDVARLELAELAGSEPAGK
ncbi:MAG: hypothetical protein AAB576_05380 [Elusimicrobiota bacterium]